VVALLGNAAILGLTRIGAAAEGREQVRGAASAMLTAMAALVKAN
jgi:hypothetical protein